MFYKNNSDTAKTFYGITFKPGEIKEVPGYVNDKEFERVSTMPKEPPKRVESSKQPTRGRPKSTTKEEEPSGTDNDQ